MRIKQVLGMDPYIKLGLLNQSINFSEEGKEAEATEETSKLIENEADGIADLTSILKPEVLKDSSAVSEIAQLTDTDPEIIKGAGEVKEKVDDEADKADLDEETKEEFFSAIWDEVKGEYIQRAFDRRGLGAFFSESLLQGNFSEEEATVDGVKIVKYVDPEKIESKGPEAIADIISEATDGDKEVIKETVEAVSEAIQFADARALALFSEAMESMAAESAELNDQNVQSVLGILKQAAEQEEQRVEGGETVSTRLPQAQGAGEAPQTETDPLKPGELPENLGKHLVDQGQGGINLGDVAQPAQVAAQENPLVAFSNPMIKIPGQIANPSVYAKNPNPGVGYYLYQAQNGALVPTNFSNVPVNNTTAMMREFADLLSEQR